MPGLFRLASTQISLAPVAEPAAYWQRLESLVLDAQKAGCKLLLLPEYACLSLLVHGYDASVPFQSRLEDFARLGYRDYESRIRDLAVRHRIHVVGGTYPMRLTDGRIVNRCVIARWNAPMLTQDKLNMTRFEAESWQISAPAAGDLEIFEVDGVRCAVTICYDVEFPRVTARAARERVQLLLVPSCTDHIHGYWRVRHCAHARTVENQCFVAMASVVDGDPRFSEMDIHYGQAAILAPCDGAFPPRGILAEGSLNQEGLCIASLDLDHLEAIRTSGSVLNLRDQGHSASGEDLP